MTKPRKVSSERSGKQTGSAKVGKRKSFDELQQEMYDQIAFLRASSAAYDAGFEIEAKRLSNTISILLHDGGRNVSLLRQVGIRTRLPLVSTITNTRTMGGVESGGTYIPASSPLTVLQLTEKGSAAVPTCWTSTRFEDMSWARAVTFHEWWERENIASPGRREITRKSLVWTVRCQEGGAHVDDQISDEAYLEFRDDPLVPGSQKLENGRVVAPDPVHWASVRQIAWELDEALKKLGY